MYIYINVVSSFNLERNNKSNIFDFNEEMFSIISLKDGIRRISWKRFNNFLPLTRDIYGCVTVDRYLQEIFL